MIKLSQNCKTIIISALFLLSISAILQANDECLAIAESFADNGNYEFAVTEYKRYLFLNPEADNRDDILYAIGIAYRNQEKWQEAIDYLDRAIAISESDSLKDSRKIAKAVIYLAQQKYNLAEFELLRINTFSRYEEIRNTADFFLALCFLYTAEWEKSQQALTDYLGSSPEMQIKIDSFFAQTSELKYKSPRLAKWFSTFLPGSGQIYAGNYHDGFNALIINSLNFYLFFDSLSERRINDALIGHLTFCERYYRGNRHNAEQTAISYNNNLNQKYSQTILDYLSNYLKDF
ncbi:MAG: tetratricopeptide repeat protein [Candidatus Cloacimonetes bacterium]|nr:tetratricopeptide repeat protein [Candidatus Cloacimonadota bacterium]